MATIRDVAKRAGASVSAVSAVLNGGGTQSIRVGAETSARIRDVARQLGYRTNPVARSLVTGRSGAMGLVFPYSSAFIEDNTFSTSVISSVLTTAVNHRWNLMLHTATGDDWNAADSGELIDPRVDGLLLVMPTPHSPLISRCLRERFPCVALVYAPENDEIYAVNSNDHAGGYMATRHLIQLGHRRIAHLEGTPTVATSAPRRQGYRDALEEAGIEIDPSLIHRADFVRHGGYDAMKTLLERPTSQWPTAVFASNDLSAEGAIEAVLESGLRIPQDIAFVGYDDSWRAALLNPPLTSIKMPIYEMGVQATEMLIALIASKEITQRQPVLPISLSVRESCGAQALRS